MVMAMFIILLIQFCYAFFFNRHHRKEALNSCFWAIGFIAVASYIVNIWVKVNYDYIAMGTVILSTVYWII